MSPLQLMLIAAIGFLGSFYGVVSGGGGLIIIPGLILAGLPAPTAVASSRLGMFGLSISGAYRFRRAGLLRARASVPLLLVVAGGATIGALLLLRIDPSILRTVIGAVTIIIAPVILLGRRLGLERDEPPSELRRRIGYIIALAIGVYAGLFGAAWATFFTYVMVAAFGMSFMEGAATRTFVGLAVGAITVIIFSIGGVIEPAPALVLFVAQAAGSYAGASYSLKRSESYARGLVALVAAVSGLLLIV
ncbi:MAG: sulfite exporter TauE/SafE family protein [Dehalococcoidia bacterium]